MEEPQEIALNKAMDKTRPQAETDFGNESFDSTPMKHGRFGGFNEWVFSLMRPKKKVVAIPRQTIPKRLEKPNAVNPPRAYQSSPDTNLFIQDSPRSFSIPQNYEVQNGLLLRKKTLAMRVRDQIRFPIIKSAAAIINAISLVIFAVGAYLLYSALPTRPDLVIGIVLVSVAGNVILSGR
jgi:hypothetical protein